MFLTKTKKSRYYQIVYYKDGKQTSKSTKTTNINEAQIILETFQKNANNLSITSIPKNPVHLKKFADEYVNLIALSCSRGYLDRSVKPAFKHLLLYFNDICIFKINSLSAEKFLLEHFQKAKYSASLYHRVLKAAFNKAQSWKYVDSNPFVGFKLPKIQLKSPKFISLDELNQILMNTPNKTMKIIFHFAFLTGMRSSEIINLTWDNVDLKNNLIKIGSENFKTKSRKVRVIPISSPVKKILWGLDPNSTSRYNYVFGKYCGYKYSSDYVSKQFKKVVRKIGLPDNIHFHTLRSSFGSYLIQKGVSISIISKLLGHSSIAVTERHYIEFQLSDLTTAMDKFN